MVLLLRYYFVAVRSFVEFAGDLSLLLSISPFFIRESAGVLSCAAVGLALAFEFLLTMPP